MLPDNGARLPETNWSAVAGVTVLDRYRADNLWRCCEAVRELEGDMAEIGAYRGGSAKLLAQAVPHKPLHVFDTWQGMPNTWNLSHGEQYFAAGPAYHDASLTQVRSFLADCPSVELYPGTFPDTLNGHLRSKRFCLLHFDGDLYRTLWDALEFFWPRMPSGGLIVLDDWGRHETPGVISAAWDFFRDKQFELHADAVRHFAATVRKP